MDTDSFKVHLKTEDIYVDNALDVDTRFDTSNSDVHRLLPKSIKKKVIGLMKDELGGRIIKEFTALISKNILTLQITVMLIRKRMVQTNV